MKNSYKTQAGRFMIEMLVIFMLLLLFAPMIYQAQVEKRQQEVNSTSSQQILQVVDGINLYLSKNDSVITGVNGGTVGGVTFDPLTPSPVVGQSVVEIKEIPLNDSELNKYLPPGLAKISANRLFKQYRVGVRRTLVDGNMSASAMVVAIPRNELDNDRISTLSSMLGAVGGSVGLHDNDADMIIGNSGVWQAKIIDFFPTNTSNIVEGSIVANVDYYVPKVSVTTTDTGAAEDLGFVHRDVGVADEPDNKATMQVDLEMGEGVDGAQHSFVNIDSVYSGANVSEIPCDPNNPDHDCLDQRYDTNFIGVTELGAPCTENDTCISINGPPNTSAYLIKPAGNTLVEDVRIGALGGAKLSELIPPMTLLEIHRSQKDGATITASKSCPTGYLPTTTVVPVATPAYHASTVNGSAWPFYALNFKNNKDTTTSPATPHYLWGSGYACADLVFNANNILAHYLSGDTVKLWAYRGDNSTLGEDRSSSERSTFSVTTTDVSGFTDVANANNSSNVGFNTSVCAATPTHGKLLLNLDSYDRCGMTNMSTAFACNEEIFTVAQRDFNTGAGTDLLRWEFYHPQVHGGYPTDIVAYTTPISNDDVEVAHPSSGAMIKVMQTRAWSLTAGTTSASYDVYIYCKFIPQVFN